MLVSEDKVLNIIRNGPPTGMSNIEISRQILEENLDYDNLPSVKVMVNGRIKELVKKGYLEQIGRRYVVTEKGLSGRSSGARLKTNYSMRSVNFPRLNVSISTPTDARGQVLLEDPKIIEALELINSRLMADDRVIIIAKKDK